MSCKILCIDDDPKVLECYQRALGKRFSIETVVGGELGLSCLKNDGPYAVVLADMDMAKPDAGTFLAQAKTEAPETVCIMLTRSSGARPAMAESTEGHVFRFLVKGSSPEILSAVLSAGLQHYRRSSSERDQIQKILTGTIRAFTEILATVDPTTAARSQKILEYCAWLGQAVGLKRTWELEAATMLYQLGHVTLPTDLLNKVQRSERLFGPEHDLVSRLPETGARLLEHVPPLETVAQIVLYQEKHFDGSGFPLDTVAGENIPLSARILKVSIDLLRLEELGNTPFKALCLMQDRAGWYDAKVLRAAFAMFDINLRGEGASPTRTVSLSQLRVGQTLMENVETATGIRIVGAHTIVSQMILQKLHNFAAVSGIKEPILIECE